MEEIKTGDVLYSKSDVLGPFYIPFSKSLHSHASIVVRENGFTNVLDVGENGITKLPLEKWEYWCKEQFYSVYRLKAVDKSRIIEEVNRLIESDPNHNLTTESVVEIYDKAGYKDVLIPVRIKDVVSFWILCIIKPINYFVKFFTGKGLNFSEPLYFIENKEQGMYKVKDVYLN